MFIICSKEDNILSPKTRKNHKYVVYRQLNARHLNARQLIAVT